MGENYKINSEGPDFHVPCIIPVQKLCHKLRGRRGKPKLNFAPKIKVLK